MTKDELLKNISTIISQMNHLQDDLVKTIEDYIKAEEPIRCPNCGGTSWGGGTDDRPIPWCNNCGADQPPRNMDVMDALESKAGYKLNDGADIKAVLRTHGIPNINKECPKCDSKLINGYCSKCHIKWRFR